MEELTAKLAQFREDLTVQEKARKDLERVRALLSVHRERLSNLAETMRRETRDVERLQGLSLQGLFYQVLGSKEEQLNKERQEMLAAILKHDQCHHDVTALEKEAAELTQRLAGLSRLDAQYESALKEKEQLLAGQDTAETRQVVALAEKTGALQATQKELKEAILAGEAVNRSLAKVMEALNSARGWGTWDMLGGGMLVTHVKHSHIDQARSHAHQAQAQAARFERELSDVHLDADISLEFSSFSKFADYFFDGLIADWVVNSKIEDSRRSARTAVSNVERVLSRLRQRLTTVAAEAQESAAERRRIIERA